MYKEENLSEWILHAYCMHPEDDHYLDACILIVVSFQGLQILNEPYDKDKSIKDLYLKLKQR